MTIKNVASSGWMTLVCVLLIIGIFNNLQGQEPMPKPSSESFSEADGIITQDTSCLDWEADLKELIPGCEKWHESFFKRHSTFPVYNIYNVDGTLWYSIDRTRSYAEAWRLTAEIGFEPFRFHTFGGEMRLTGESDNWYRVEVNEATKMEKYVSKTEDLWQKISWRFFVLRSRTVDICCAAKLMDQPNGGMVNEVLNNDLSKLKLFITNMSGDWIHVRVVGTQKSG